MPTQQRLAGILVLLGIIFAVVWRVAIAPAMLGDFDPADMPHRDRAFLSIGNVGVSLLFATALWIVSRTHAGTSTERLARAAAAISAAGAAMAFVGTVGLIWSEAPIHALEAYVVCTGIAWALSGCATFLRHGGGLGWAALLTGVVYAIAAVAVFAGAFIIFIMTVAVLPFAIALIVSDSGAGELRPAV